MPHDPKTPTQFWRDLPKIPKTSTAGELYNVQDLDTRYERRVTIESPVATAAQIAKDVRAYVRDEFVPGSLVHLDMLEQLVRSKVILAFTKIEVQKEQP